MKTLQAEFNKFEEEFEETETLWCKNTAGEWYTPGKWKINKQLSPDLHIKYSIPLPIKQYTKEEIRALEDKMKRQGRI